MDWDISLQELSEALSRAYDEDYDRLRLEKQWASQGEQDYNLEESDDDESGPEVCHLDAKIFHCRMRYFGCM